MAGRRCHRCGIIALLALAVAVALPACERERRDFDPPAVRHPAARDARAFDDPGAALEALVDPYPANAWALGEGRRLFEWFNCVGCHAHGGGGIGPALTVRGKMMGGGSPETIFAVIVGGTPNGMPAFGARLTNADVWKLVAYVRSLGGNVREDVVPARNDEMQPTRAGVEAAEKPAPPCELDVLRKSEDEQLESYAWVDRTAGVVRIPIERAMELLGSTRQAR